MPEGHTIHKLARDLSRDLGGERLRASSPQGRFEEGAARIDGARLASTDAWGKHLLLDFGGERVHVHLGLFGRFRRRRSPAGEPTPGTRLRLESTTWTWDLSGPTLCEIVTQEGYDTVRSRLGPDPLRRDADPRRFFERARKSRRPIGALLLDQSVIAGIGNVYRAELLFLAGLRPDRPGGSLSTDELQALWDLGVAQLRRGARSGRIVTVPENAPRRGERLWVYKRRRCRACGDAIAREELANRAIWWCPTCQAP